MQKKKSTCVKGNNCHFMFNSEFQFRPFRCVLKVSFGGFYYSVYNRYVYVIVMYVMALVSLAEIESYIIMDEDSTRRYKHLFYLN